MRLLVPLLTACIICPVLADVTVTHRFEKSGSYQLAGSPNLPPKILAIAGKSLRLDFPGFKADPKPAVQLYQINSARKISIQTPEAVSTAEGSQWTWTPPNTRSTANYEFIFEGEPKQIVFLEIRDATWLKATLEMLTNQVTWDAQGLSNDERTALTAHGLRLDQAVTSQKKNIASLQCIPRQGDAARRRVVWDEQESNLVVWRQGPSTGDVEIRAPRWWISPAALATDQGLIRFLDLFSEPPYNP
jgi:hypothetical protein